MAEKRQSRARKKKWQRKDSQELGRSITGVIKAQRIRWKQVMEGGNFGDMKRR